MSVARYFNPRLRVRILSGEIPRWLQRHPRKSYILTAILSSPPWTDRERIKALRDKARALTERTGIPHVLDHIVPLSHPYVCGLTVPDNFRIVPQAVNAAKSNKWTPDQIEFFTEPEQLRLDCLSVIAL
jgi:hypothetical protein